MNKNTDYWYKDGVIYQVHIKAFRDSNADGKGDIAGITEKLDYIKSLGITIIWLLPFYPSPLKDDGYDIADYLNINPDYGTIEDFKKLIKEAHKRGIKIITELVLNHTSDQHNWFQKARKSKPGSPERNFYVWSDTPNKYTEARIIFSDFETSNWAWDNIANAYYWHRFYSHQPDLNFENPEVHKQLLRVVDYWFELGVDGMRLDAVPYLYEREGTNCENLPETHQFLKKLNAHVQNKFKNKILLAEANQWPEDAVAYFGNGDECHMAFHFPVMPRMYMALQMETRFPIIDIIEQTPPIPENCQWAMFLRNHDELTLEMVTDEERDYMYRYYAKDKTARVNLGIRRRLAPLIDNNRRKIELLNILLFSFPGTPIIYYGDEIGMGDNYYLGDRHGVRTPMQWSADRNAGFSSANPQRLYLPVIIDSEYHYETVNVEVQNRNPSSLLWWMKKTITFRNRYKALGRGTIEFLSPSNSKVLAFIRRYEDEKILVVANLSRFSQFVELDLSKFKGNVPIEIFSGNEFPPIGDLYYMLTLTAYDYYWFLISEKEKITLPAKKEIPILETRKKWEEIFEEDKLELLQNKLIPDSLEQMQISIDKSKIQAVQLNDIINLSEKISLLILRINYLDKPSEYYFLFIGITPNLPYNIKDAAPREVIAVIKNNESEFYLVNCFYNDELRSELFKTFLNKKTFSGNQGEFQVSVSKKIKTAKEKPSPVRILREDKNSISLLIDEMYVLKFYKKPEEGINPEEEILNFLKENTNFTNVTPLTGSIKYSQPSNESFTFGILTEHIRSEDDAWKFFSDSFDNYFDRLSIRKEEKKEFRFINSLFDENFQISLFEEFVDNIFTGMSALLGERTGEMHIALSSSEEPGIKAEPVTVFYQRSIYQAMRSHIKSTFRLLKSEASSMSEDSQRVTLDLLNKEQSLLNFIERILKIKLAARKIRIHGNYNLKQILFTGKDFVITNFEGQPTVPFSERRLKRSPLRDIASLIFSLHTLTYHKLSKQQVFTPEEFSKAESFAYQWWLSVSRIILTKYYKTITSEKENIILQADKTDVDYLILIYLFEKVLVDLSYGLTINADWVNLKLKALTQLFEHISLIV